MRQIQQQESLLVGLMPERRFWLLLSTNLGSRSVLYRLLRLCVVCCGVFVLRPIKRTTSSSSSNLTLNLNRKPTVTPHTQPHPHSSPLRPTSLPTSPSNLTFSSSNLTLTLPQVQLCTNEMNHGYTPRLVNITGAEPTDSGTDDGTVTPASKAPPSNPTPATRSALQVSSTTSWSLG